MTLLAVDTETTTCPEKRLVCLSFASEFDSGVLHRPTEAQVIDLLIRHELVFHNAGFDYHVLTRAFPSLRLILDEKVEQGSVHDTMLLDILVNIADGSRAMREAPNVRSRSLDVLAQERGIKLEKDDTIRLGFGAYEHAPALPPAFEKYAREDAEATLAVAKHLLRRAESLAQTKTRYPVFPDARERFGLLSENVQVKGAIALAWLEQFGICVDKSALAEKRAQFEIDAAALQDKLIGFQLGSRDKKGIFHLKLNAVRFRLGEYAKAHGITPPRSKTTGGISTERDFWRDFLGDEDPSLAAWYTYSGVTKILTSFLRTYDSAPRHFPRYWCLGARTGRTSATDPSIQQVPKHKGNSIRGIFIPTEGYTFLEGDFAAAELLALAEIYEHMFGGSALGTALRTGADPHIETAKRIYADAWPSMSDADKKRGRQISKCCNFGTPGGMGVAKFRGYLKKQARVSLTEGEVRSLLRAYKKSDPSLRAYLDDIPRDEFITHAAKCIGVSRRTLETTAGAVTEDEDGNVTVDNYKTMKALRSLCFGDETPIRALCPRSFDIDHLGLHPTATLTGRIRGNATYTEARNTPFQGLISDAIKLALWNLFKEWTPAAPWRPITEVHDSVLIESQPEFVESAEALLTRTMSSAILSVCPSLTGARLVDVKKGPTWALGES